MASVAERVLEMLRHGPLDEDELAGRLGVIRQQVNQACRLLASRGLLAGEVGPRGKIENSLSQGQQGTRPGGRGKGGFELGSKMGKLLIGRSR
jgi:DNA-binding transcriptional MocR family regulator